MVSVASNHGSLHPEVSQFDLSAEIAKSEQNKPWPSGIHSRLLLKTGDMRVVPIAMERGAKIREHQADGTISVHVLRGALRFNAQEHVATLGTGHLLTLLPAIKHSVEALQETAFLLTKAANRVA